MPTRMLTAAAVALGFVCPAYAETRMFVSIDDSDRDDPTIVIPAPSRGQLGRVELEVREEGRATLLLALRSTEPTAHTIATTLDIPPGTRVTGMAVTIGGVRSQAQTMAARAAREQFDRVVRHKDDPALLELTSSTQYFDRLKLDVFPVAHKSPAKVEIMLELPAATTIAIDTPARLAIMQGGRTLVGNTIAVPPRAAHVPLQRGFAELLSSSELSLVTSLYAGEAASVPTVRIGVPTASCGFHHNTSVSSRDIRKRVKLSIARLSHCYTRELQRNWKLEGSAVMHFTIAPDGRTQDITVDGTLDDATVRACIAGEIASWSFHAASTAVRVNYPLQLQRAR